MILVESGIQHKRVEIPQLTRYNVCNPSIVATPSGYECTVRGVNYDLEHSNHEYIFYYGSYSVPFPDTQNYYVILNDDLEIKNYWFLEDRHLRTNILSLEGIEDLRLFYWKGKRYAIGNAINYPSSCASITLMTLEGNVLNFEAIFNSPTKAKTEKNWMPFVQGEELHLLYTPNGQLLTYKDELTLTRTDSDNGLLNWSGSSCLMERDGKYYAVIHKREKSRYTHKLVEYDLEGNLLWQSKDFNFEQFGIEFCAGMAFKDDDVVFSYGVMDKKAALLKMKFNDLMGVVK
jgi:predicted GH43/DUF377 family glycosyl hydrolase